MPVTTMRVLLVRCVGSVAELRVLQQCMVYLTVYIVATTNNVY